MIEKPSLRNLTGRDYGRPPNDPNEFLKSLGAPHVESFDYALDEGLVKLTKNLLPVEFPLNDSVVRISIESLTVLPPAAPFAAKTSKVYPSECRQRAGTYNGKVIANIEWSINGEAQTPVQKDIGSIPIMLMSKLCHLSTLKPSELLERGEHADEWGGYFVVKGNEKIIRMLLLTRRNFPIAVKRPTWKQRGHLYSDIGVIIRSVSEDETSVNNVLHFVTDGTAKVMLPFRKMLYYVPLFLLMKCLVNLSDEAIFKTVMDSHEDDLYMKQCLLNMMRSLHQDGIHTQTDAKEFIGKIFAVRLPGVKLDTDAEVCDFLLERCLLIHAKNNEDKFNCLVLMTQKLFSLVDEKSLFEGVDAVMMQELMVGGYLYLQVLKDKIENWLTQLKYTILKKANSGFILNYTEFNFCLRMTSSIESSFENFLSTGNLSSNNLVLPQDKGLIIIAENLNRMRYMAHFRAVHRGAFFKGMRTTEARMLLPDAWGFICPVHTPDGEPCGLLNHLAKECQVSQTIDPSVVAKIPQVVASLGMAPFTSRALGKNRNCYTVMLDGIVIGLVNQNMAGRLVDKLRTLKILGLKLPKTLEIVFIPKSVHRGQFPGLYLFTGPARMMRPVYNIAVKQIELIGTFEQIYLDISLTEKEIHPGVTTHLELSKTSFLSNLASLIPMPDCNQSPRNMYQCQMGKQTMGTPCHNWQFQSATKLYRLQTPASPLFRPLHYDRINLDDFPMGTNAIVAVISYTGYDMEDAMVINKSALERGFAYACIFKTEFVELSSSNSYFALDPSKPELKDFLGDDGLPHPGGKLSQDVPLYCYFDYDKSFYVVGKYTSSEPAVVDSVKLSSSFVRGRTVGLACISFRVPRNPTIGDKFASRAGQKGICSQTWPAEDLPFTESGLVPDIIFNPNSFPSRMTIAMMIECMAGKAAVVHGTVHDATPFEFSEDNTAIDYFGKLLREGGYNYYGTERLYSGVNGCEMNADIFFGVVHYQRLRHMVSDKWQVRSTGPVDVLTRQPVKGRKRGGGVRFGEMERDSLISHGASFLLQDRLFHCSDKTTALVCRECNTLLGPILATSTSEGDTIKNTIIHCRLCLTGGRIEKIEIPYIFRYLVSQLASININVKLQLTENNLINVC